MTKKTNQSSRRRFLKGAGAALAYSAAAGMFAATPLRKVLSPISEAVAETLNARPAHLTFAGTDGWISVPDTTPVNTAAFGVVHPDSKAPAPFSTYIFGFRNVTGLSQNQILAQKFKAQHNAPIFWVDEYKEAENNEFLLDLTNLGLGNRPDLVDSHTIHWHGFRNVVPYFDGEPMGSIAVTVARKFRYVFRPRDPGTYMFHCHVEDVEHVQMGMTGVVFVKPKQNGNTALYRSGKYAYNDGDGSTGYDREFVMLATEVWATSHWCDAHIQLPEWSEYRPDFSLLNGRMYPDTLVSNSPYNEAASQHAFATNTDEATGDLIAPAGHPELQYQPLSALVRCNADDRVLLRMVNLGYREAAMTLTGLDLKVVGKDATPMRGLNSSQIRDISGADTSYGANTVSMSAGESVDAIFTAPAFVSGVGGSDEFGDYNTYIFYNRAYNRSSNLAGSGYGGQRTEVRVYASGTLDPQTIPNTSKIGSLTA